eukprot:scaffold56567_cov35-Tisochrysis_lutea.AAC.5
MERALLPSSSPGPPRRDERSGHDRRRAAEAAMRRQPQHPCAGAREPRPVSPPNNKTTDY